MRADLSVFFLSLWLYLLFQYGELSSLQGLINIGSVRFVCGYKWMLKKKKKKHQCFCYCRIPFFFQQNIWELNMNYDMWDIQWVTAGWAFVARTPSLPGSNRKKQSIHTKQCKVGALIVFFSFIAQKRHADSRRNEHARNSSRSFRLL